jgi:hypothetical protein
MSVSVFFRDFDPEIRKRFATAVSEAGKAASHLALELREQPYEAKQWAAEFSVTPPAGPVRITWAGIGSLWACSQGAMRLARRMSEAKRRVDARSDAKLQFADDQELGVGIDLLELCRRFCKNDMPPQSRDAPKWFNWAPKPEISPTSVDGKIGNNLFFGALSWIMRHEIAHVTLQHTVVVDSIAAENEADRQATEWFRGELRSDPDRAPSAPPGHAETQLEMRAIAIGLGLIWVAIFESLVGQSSLTHPPSAERIFRCIDLLGLKQDSMAAEVLSDTIQVWIDPTGNWAPEGGYSTANAALDDALDRLNRFYR